MGYVPSVTWLSPGCVFSSCLDCLWQYRSKNCDATEVPGLKLPILVPVERMLEPAANKPAPAPALPADPVAHVFRAFFSRHLSHFFVILAEVLVDAEFDRRFGAFNRMREVPNNYILPSRVR